MAISPATGVRFPHPMLWAEDDLSAVAGDVAKVLKMDRNVFRMNKHLYESGIDRWN